MRDKESLMYEGLSDGAKFREQYRFIFSAAIIATFFVIPDNNALWQFLYKATGFSALFAAAYLIMSAAQIKYREPGRAYEAFRMNESLRMRMFDWSVHVFAIMFLFFISIFPTILLFDLYGVPAEGTPFWIVLTLLFFSIGLIFLIFEYYSHQRKSDKPLPKI